MAKKLTILSTRTLSFIHANAALPELMQRMEPTALAQMFVRIGLNDSAEMMSLVPSHKLVQALDARVWKSPRPGVAEAFDQAEFIEWLEVWLEIGDDFVADRMALIEDTYLVFCFSGLLRVVQGSTNALEHATEEDEPYADHAGFYDTVVYGSYLVAPINEDHRDVVQGCLDALWLHAPDRLLFVLGRLSVEESVLAPDPLRAGLRSDIAFEREKLRERRGFVTPMGARSFLGFASAASIDEILALSEYDLETQRHLSSMDLMSREAHPADAMEESAHVPVATTEPPGVEELQSVLEDAGLIDPPIPRLLLPRDGVSSRSLLLETLAQLAAEDAAAFHVRGRELAYLASVLIAGISIDEKLLGGHEARGAAMAICNLGLEFLRARKLLPKLALEPGLIRPFLVGWRTLNGMPKQVVAAFHLCLRRPATAEWFRLHPWSHEQARIGIADMDTAVDGCEFLAAREACLFLSFVFDSAACRGVMPLLDELPRYPTILDGTGIERVRWIESLADLDRIALLLRNVDIKA